MLIEKCYFVAYRTYTFKDGTLITMYSRVLPFSLRDPAWFAFVVSLLLSIINIVSDDNINPDGILYVETARLFLEQGWQASIAHYKWPFYSIIIAGFSKLTWLDFETSAHVLNVLLLGLMAYVFVRCSQALGGDRRVAFFAAILLLTNIVLNEYRDLIVRDAGYWAFFFTAVLLFLRYNNTGKNKYLIGSSFAMILATLFRIEGSVFIILMPLLLIFQAGSVRERLYSCFVALLPMLIGAVGVVIYIVLSSSNDVGRLFAGLNFLQGALASISYGIAEKAQSIALIMGNGNRSLGSESVLAILFMILISKTYNVVGFVAALFSYLTLNSSAQRQKINGLGILIGIIGINLIVLIVFLLSKSFLSSRYVITFGLLITLLAPFSLAAFFSDELEQKFLQSKAWQRRVKIFISLIFVYTLLDGVISLSASKSYLRESGVWLKNNIAADEKLWSNETSLYYYSDRYVDRPKVKLLRRKTHQQQLPYIGIIERNNFDYLAVKVKHKQKGFEDRIIAWLDRRPIHQTSNERGDKVLIFKLK